MRQADFAAPRLQILRLLRRPRGYQGQSAEKESKEIIPPQILDADITDLICVIRDKKSVVVIPCPTDI